MGSADRRSWTPGWRMTVFAFVMLPVLVALGFWQLERAEEKRALIEDFLREQNALAELPGEEISSVAFKRLRLVGRYEPGRYFLVDNQVRAGLTGYAIVASFLASDGRRWLVNRGWVAAPVSRDQFPEIESPEGVQTVVGMLWPDLGLIPLAGKDPWSSSWPKRVQRLNLARMASQLDRIVPREVRLEAGQPGVLTPPGLNLAVQPEKHTGYAVQWFALAGVLALGYVAYGSKNREKRADDSADSSHAAP